MFHLLFGSHACHRRNGSAAALSLLLTCLASEHPHAAPFVELTVKPGGGIPDWVNQPERCRVEEVDGITCLDIEADRDPYTKVEWDIRFQVREPMPAAVTLEIEFLDRGAGVIEPRLACEKPGAVRSVPPGLSWLGSGLRSSYTRLNTGTVRQAWFAFNGPSLTETNAKVTLRIAGLQGLRAIRLLPQQEAAAWTARRASVPRKVKPMVTLRRPMDLVTTAGVDVVGDLSALEASLEAMNDLAPLARVLGFTSIESYVTWKRLEPREEGQFDFSFYDAVVQRLAEYDLKWFPLLIVGSGYALPDWFMKSPENRGFVCLEHGLTNAIQSIWAPAHRRHVTRVLQAFGKHYEPMGVLEGVRLGPSGNYGESQYPAGGNWGPGGGSMHIHIGWWAGDADGAGDFRRWLRGRYADIAALNAAWGTSFLDFDDVRPRLPEAMLRKAERLDFTAWYTDSMSDWCAWWAEEARRVLPRTRIYQSAGGWGFREAGTDYSSQAKGMKKVGGGMRLTNETDSYEQNFYATRLAVTAARHYGVALGFEPASSHTARGVAGRFFSTATADGDHLFTYHNNVFDHGLEIERWLKLLPVLDHRQEPLVEVAVYYPETENQVGDAGFRHLYAWGFNPVAREIRRVVEVDYLDDNLVREGFLDRYRVLVFAWGNQIPADVQERVDRWLRAGGTVIYPSFPRGPQEAVPAGAGPRRDPASATALFQRWAAGDVRQGGFHRFPGDAEPPELYGEFVSRVLRGANLHTWTRAVLEAQRPARVFLSVQRDGHALVLNYRDEPARVTLQGKELKVEPYGIERVPLAPEPPIGVPPKGVSQ